MTTRHFLCALLAPLLLLFGALDARAERGAAQLLTPCARGERGSHVRALQQALIAGGYLDGEPDGHFADDTMAALIAFQKEKGIRADGRADAFTLRVLMDDMEEDQGKPTRPYWYGGGSGMVPVGASFQVLDVRSGVMFRCARVWGQSHLDAEPLTPHDSFQMLTAYGGEWRYDRRPILLRYREQVIAASMMGMPHGHEVIPDNGMVGHFCIHFYGSRGDGSQRVDAGHQACVLEALSGRWP